MKFASPTIQEQYLLHASPELVYEMIAEASRERRSRFSEVLPIELSRKLLDRNEPLINLALAAYSDDVGLLLELYEKGNDAIRIAVLSNTNRDTWPSDREWLSEDQIKAICNSQSGEIVSAFFNNKLLSGKKLEAVFLRKGLYAELTEEVWGIVLYYALQNPNVTKIIEYDPYAIDGWNEYIDGLPRKAAWSLLDSLEVTIHNATILCGNKSFDIPFELPDKIDVPKDSPPSDSSTKLDEATVAFFSRVLEKWSARNSRDEGAYFKDGKENFHFEILREAIASKAPTYRKSVLNLLKTHPDVYVRRGYYRIFNPRTAAEIEELFKKDGKDFLETAVWNDNLYKINPFEVRRKFHRIVQYSREDGPPVEFEDRQRIRRGYDENAKRLSEQNPKVYCEDPDDFSTDDKGKVSSSEAGMILNESIQQMYDKISEISDRPADKDQNLSGLSQILKMIAKSQMDLMTRINLMESRAKQMLIWLFIIVLVFILFFRR